MYVTYNVGFLSVSSNQVTLDTGLSSYTIQFVFQSTTASSIQDDNWHIWSMCLEKPICAATRLSESDVSPTMPLKQFTSQCAALTEDLNKVGRSSLGGFNRHDFLWFVGVQLIIWKKEKKKRKKKKKRKRGSNQKLKESRHQNIELESLLVLLTY